MRIKDIELDAAFMWGTTREGVAYWSALNDKWLEERQSLKEQLLSND